MLSKAERRYAKNRRDGDVDVDPAYERTLRYRIRNKVEQAESDIRLLKEAGLVEEDWPR